MKDETYEKVSADYRQRRGFTEDTHIVYNKYTGEPYAQISLAGPEQVEAAASAAYEAFRSVPFDALARYNVLMKASQLLSERVDDLAMTMVAEAGKDPPGRQK